MTSQRSQQAIAMHLLTNISRSKGSLTMGFGQSKEHNMRNISLEKSYTRCGGEINPRPFSKKVNIEQISGSIV